MNILHYINNLGSGGAEKLLTDILPIMKEKGHNVFVVIANSNNNFEKYEQLLKYSEIKVFEIGNSFYNPKQILKLLKFIKKNNVEIVHSHLFPTQYWLAIASIFISKNIKLVKTEHNAHNHRRDIKFLRPIEKLIYSRYSLIIAITDKVSENLKEWIGKNHTIEVIKNGVNLDQIKNEIDKETTLKFNADQYNILMVGSFDGRQKDQLNLIKALEYLPNDVSIYFIGKGPVMNEIKHKVDQLGFSSQVIFLGIRKDVYALMSIADLNVLSTNYEGLSGVALEAMASGKPFIGSNVHGVQEVVPSPYFLFPPKNPKALADKILELKLDRSRANNMVIESLKHVKAYDTPIMVTQYLKIYKELLYR